MGCRGFGGRREERPRSGAARKETGSGAARSPLYPLSGPIKKGVHDQSVPAQPAGDDLVAARLCVRTEVPTTDAALAELRERSVGGGCLGNRALPADLELTHRPYRAPLGCGHRKRWTR
ncbi:MAG: hypothetical protein ACREP8_06705, partial [Candidatus Binatia bacterium]